MKCYCDISHGGDGKSNTPYTYHLYICEFYLDELEDYSYEEFKRDYEKMEEEKKARTKSLTILKECIHKNNWVK